MITTPPTRLRWNYVDRVELSPPAPGIAAFAIDTPRVGDRLPGAGLEINGWVVGQDAPVRGVRVVVSGSASEPFPLAIRRPDVAADYPAFAHAAESGFSFWAPLPDQLEPWQLLIEAVMDSSGTSTPLCVIHGHAEMEQRIPRDGSRLVTAPDFVIIGTQRGGTTSLHAYLRAHPQVQVPATKELQYVTDRYLRGRDWYLGQFPSDLPIGSVTGEATPYALFHPASPRRLYEVAPHAKLIVLLRNPIDRAYSQFLHETSRGYETLPYDLALEAESSRLAGEEARLLADPAYVSAAHNHASYLSRGDYAPQLERWLALYPREQFLILRSEYLYQRPAETFALVTTFLGLSEMHDIPFDAHNRTSGPPLDTVTRARLAQHFAPLKANLSNLLGWRDAWD